MFCRCAEIVHWQGRKRRFNSRVLVKSVSSSFDFRKVTSLGGVGVNPVSIAEQSHITQSLLGTGIIASYFVLVELWNSDSSMNADDCNDNQQCDECETGFTIMKVSSPIVGNHMLFN